jgi:hypothetical protein
MARNGHSEPVNARRAREGADRERGGHPAQDDAGGKRPKRAVLTHLDVHGRLEGGALTRERDR